MERDARDARTEAQRTAEAQGAGALGGGPQASVGSRSAGAPGAVDARAVLKDHNLRFSRPRERILDYLLEEEKHVSAEGLYLALKQRGEKLSLSTIYLNLGVLTEAGLVCEFKGASGQSLYDSNVAPHYHVVCRETGRILDVAAPTVDGKPLGRYLKDAIEAATGWQVDEPRLSLSGLSPEAQRDDD